MQRLMRIALLSVVFIVPYVAVPSGHASLIYAVGADATNSPVYTIDTDTGTQTLLGNSGVANLNALTFSPTGVLYAAGGAPGSNVLVTLDPTTGAATSSVSVNTGTSQSFIRSLAFDSAGTLWAGNQPSAGLPQSGQTRLYTINTSTGVGTPIGFMGFITMEGLDFSSSGTLYGVASDGLRTVNTTTGASALVGQRFPIHSRASPSGRTARSGVLKREPQAANCTPSIQRLEPAR